MHDVPEPVHNSAGIRTTPTPRVTRAEGHDSTSARDHEDGTMKTRGDEDEGLRLRQGHEGAEP